MNTKNHTLAFANDHGTVRLLPERGRVPGIKVDGNETLWQPDGTAIPVGKNPEGGTTEANASASARKPIDSGSELGNLI